MSLRRVALESEVTAEAMETLRAARLVLPCQLLRQRRQFLVMTLGTDRDL